MESFEQIEAWQLAQHIYSFTIREDFGLKRQMQRTAGSAMNNTTEGFDSETNAEFIRFLRYAKRL